MNKVKILTLVDYNKYSQQEAFDACLKADENGADGVLLLQASSTFDEREKYFEFLRKVIKELDIFVAAACVVEKAEDIKKAFYTGAGKVVIGLSEKENEEAVAESLKRFGSEKVIFADKTDIYDSDKTVFVSSEPDSFENICNAATADGEETLFYAVTDYMDVFKTREAFSDKNVVLAATENAVPFENLKLNENGMIPVITTDYRTGEVLMLAYMNKEAYEKTLRTGQMTYYSRSRQELWLKGETSGHFQYLKNLTLDCDNDTLLAGVRQVGAACHTGNRTCFFNRIFEKETALQSPLTVLDEVYSTITDRKVHPKEGSYTNYLFDKGIDKILKKCGEEATEIVIAAKNPDTEELKYEIADFLYHMMVLMAEKGLDWDDITQELANRH